MNEIFPDGLLADFFRGAVAYYNAKPWQILGVDDQVRVNVDRDAPYFAFATGSPGGSVPGLMLTSAFPTDDVEADELGLVAFGSDRVCMTYIAEADAPEWLRTRHRARKWKLASPAAFPWCETVDAQGAKRAPTIDEFREMSIAVNVMAAFVGKHRKQLVARDPSGDVIKVRENDGAEHVAMVQFPFDPEDLSGWRDYKFRNVADSSSRALQEVWNAALDVPHAPRALDRLVWSFFQDAGPTYEQNDEDEESAFYRFLSWALFGFRSERGTLAEQGLQRLSETMSDDELDTHRRVVNARGSIFRVTAVEKKRGFHAHDELNRDTVDIVERVATRQLQTGDGVLGMLHPVSDTQWVLSPGCVVFPSMNDIPSTSDALTAETFAPSLEQQLFGANMEWVQQLDANEIADAYNAFANSVAETGDGLPAYEELSEIIAETDMPGAVMQRLSVEVNWWSESELNFMLALLMRAWNLTPRAELGGQAPESVAAGQKERVRAKPRGGGGRRR